jgi:hypothetical protein
MRGWGVSILLAANLAGQTVAPVGVVRGELLAHDAGDSGESTVRVADHRVYTFEYDATTVVESGGELARIAQDPSAPAPAAAHRPRARLSLPPEDSFPRGALTFSGAVASVAADRLILRTRGGGEQAILFRTDTKFLERGVPVERGKLPVNAHVFVRAGETVDGQVEAFAVVWGGILKPD